MNCENYLSMLATVPVEELEYGDARNHAAQCHDCDRVTRVVAERERNLRMAYGELYPSVATVPITAHTLMISRRRRIALFYRIGLGVLTVATLLFFVVTRRVTPAPSRYAIETFRLQCLSPAQAAEVLRPVRSENVSVVIPPGSVGIIRVTAGPAEMARIRSLMDRYDSAAASECGVQLRVPK